MPRPEVPLRERLIFALDLPSPAEAQRWVERLEPQVGFFKVGLELFVAGGLPVVDWIVGRGHKVMLDLKFHDIPATVGRAVRLLTGHGITFATVHGRDGVVEAAVAARGDRGDRSDSGALGILAVTVLTSTPNYRLNSKGEAVTEGRLEDLVLSRAGLAVSKGCSGVVCSGREAPMLRRELGEGFVIVTPGIRPAAGGDDQVRVTTAGQAIANGADHVVVGRPIRDAQDPLAVAVAMQEEIRAVVGGGRRVLPDNGPGRWA